MNLVQTYEKALWPPRVPFRQPGPTSFHSTQKTMGQSGVENSISHRDVLLRQYFRGDTGSEARKAHKCVQILLVSLTALSERKNV
jgi:hypothetical protein